MNVLESNHHLQYAANAPGSNPHHIRLPSIKEVSCPQYQEIYKKLTVLFFFHR